MLRFVQGDATAPVTDGPAIIAHVCNDIGRWGKGFVVALSKRWNAPEARYRQWFAACERNDFRLGAVQLVEVGPALWVANMVAQRGIRPEDGVPPIRYDAVETCLGTLATLATERGASVHMPRIGCGLAGGQWSEIEPRIERTLVAAGVEVVVYDLA